MANKINSKSELITNGNILKALLSLIIPMSIGMFSLLVINLVDAYYIGKLGVLELSAISYAFPVLFTLMSFNIGIAIGISATVSKYIGQGDLYKAKKMNLLQPIDSDKLKILIPPHLKDIDNQWFGLSIRSRVIMYNPKKVNKSELSTYEDLAN